MMWYRFTSPSLFVNPNREVIADPGVPSMGCLLQPLPRSLELAHMRLMIEGIKTFWLLYVPIYVDSANIDLIDEYLGIGEKASS